ncbi:IS1634 family transposase [Patescibacteria group bacterium]|nr:IS1634 family transposase [Patescibacteria group bacterium]
MENALKGQALTPVTELQSRSGKHFGGIFVLHQIAKELYIEKVLKKSRQAKLALIMIFGRILTQGSRRHLTFWQEGQAVQEILGIESFTTDDLYNTLDWLDKHQVVFEKKLFQSRYGKKKIKLFLYDITSSYFEGNCNELAEYGYNRDGKKGKKQILVGLMTDSEGYPVAVEVFKGNIKDSVTVPEQITKLAERFDAQEIIFVGDRGMLKRTGIAAIAKKENWCYITAITKPQIKKLINSGTLQMELFDEDLCEIEDAGIRYIVRRNLLRKKEIEANRNDRIRKIHEFQEELNSALKEKHRKSVDVALRKLNDKIRQYKLSKIFTTILDKRMLLVTENKETWEEVSRLDGCYVIKTTVQENDMNAEQIHSSYKNLKFVEWAFRSMKTTLLELRPLFHRKANRTRALAFVAMLAYMIIYHIWGKCKHLDIPLEEIISRIEDIQTIEIKAAERWIPKLPSLLRNDQQILLDALEIRMPKAIKHCSTC